MTIECGNVEVFSDFERHSLVWQKSKDKSLVQWVQRGRKRIETVSLDNTFKKSCCKIKGEKWGIQTGEEGKIKEQIFFLKMEAIKACLE